MFFTILRSTFYSTFFFGILVFSFIICSNFISCIFIIRVISNFCSICRSRCVTTTIKSRKTTKNILRIESTHLHTIHSHRTIHRHSISTHWLLSIHLLHHAIHHFWSSGTFWNTTLLRRLSLLLLCHHHLLHLLLIHLIWRSILHTIRHLFLSILVRRHLICRRHLTLTLLHWTWFLRNYIIFRNTISIHVRFCNYRNTLWKSFLRFLS